MNVNEPLTSSKDLKRFEYVPAALTNVMKTFKNLGWVPPTEEKKDE